MYQYVQPFHNFGQKKWKLKNVYTFINQRLPIFTDVRSDIPFKFFKSTSVIDESIGYYEQFDPDRSQISKDGQDK